MKDRNIRIRFAASILLAIMPIHAIPQALNFAPNSPASFSVFSLPQNMGLPVNTADNESRAVISPNGLSLYFSSNTSGSQGSLDIWVSQRPTLTSAWGVPQNLTMLNTDGVENLPVLSPDGMTLFYNSSGLAGFGGADIFMTTREDVNDDLGWSAPVNLGAVVNTSANEVGAGYFEDPATGSATLYFSSDRIGGLGEDIYQSTRNKDGTFDTPTNVVALNSSSLDRGAFVRRDGLEVVFASDRDGGSGDRDVWVSARASTSAPWNPPVNLAAVNSSGIDQSPAFSSDGTILYVASTRDGSSDIYTSTRVSINRSPIADFDGDGRTDLSIFRPSDGTWHILDSGTDTYRVQQFGLGTDKIVPGDYDGDSRTDLAVFRPSTGDWWIMRSSDSSVSAVHWGISSDTLVPADYDGDGRTDLAVYRDGTWYITYSSNGSIDIRQFGLSDDVPATAGAQQLFLNSVKSSNVAQRRDQF